MKKRICSFLLAFCLLCVTFAPSAFAANSAAAQPRQGQAQVFEKWWMLVDQSGRLHVYDRENGNKETIPMTGVSTITRTIDDHALVLKTDGTLWLMAQEYYNHPTEDRMLLRLTKPLQIRSGVKKAVGSFILCQNGDLYSLNNLDGIDAALLMEYISFTKLGTNVADVDELGYFISENKLMRGWPNCAAEERMILPFSDGVQFYGDPSMFSPCLVRTADGDVWAWGSSTCGGVGNGLSYDRLYQWGYNRENGWYPTILQTFTPVKILSGVDSLWTEDETAFYAIKKDDSVWKWGDGQLVMSYWDNDSEYMGETRFPDDLTGYTPRKITTPDHWDFTYDYDLIRFQNDGSCRAGKWATDTANNYQATYSDWVTLSNWADDPGNTTPFTDVKSSQYYYEPIKWAVERGITSGTSATTFSPNQTCTRGQIITFLWRAAGSPEPKNATPFSDVKADAYYAKATAWAAEQGIEKGSAFSPDAPCTRLMAVEFMWKYADSPKAPEAVFTDVASGAVNWAVKQGVTSGTSTTTFSPEQTCTRAQIMTFLYRGFAE